MGDNTVLCGVCGENKATQYIHQKPCCNKKDCKKKAALCVECNKSKGVINQNSFMYCLNCHTIISMAIAEEKNQTTCAMCGDDGLTKGFRYNSGGQTYCYTCWMAPINRVINR